MIERFIRKNINLLNHHITMGFLESKNIYPTEDEAIIITNFLKENYQALLRGEEVLQNLQGQIRDPIFKGCQNILINLKNQYL